MLASAEQMAFQANIEEKLNSRSAGLKTIQQLNKDFAKTLVQINKNNAKHRKQMRKHKLKVRKQRYGKPISLAQVKSSLQQPKQQQLSDLVVQKGHASVKAPKDKEKLKLVQINNQRPSKKQIA